MAEREIVKMPDPVLRKQAKQVPKIDEDTKKLVDDMIETMRSVNGLGLAANQVGVLQKVFVYDDGNGVGVMINPKITHASGQQTGVEGCLSIPGLQGDVTRANEIEIKGTDLKGKPIRIEAEGLLARIFQHEFDHLEGKVFTDRADPKTLYYITDDEEEGKEDIEEEEL